MGAATKLDSRKTNRRLPTPLALCDKFQSLVQSIAQRLAEKGQADSSILHNAVQYALAGFAWCIYSGKKNQISAADFFAATKMQPAPSVSIVGLIADVLKPEFLLLSLEQPAVLAKMYEHILSFRLESSESQAKLVFDAKAKKRQGNFYTPKHLADLAVAQSLEELVADKTLAEILTLRIVDPSMGGGSFLASALQYIVAMMQTRKSVEMDSNHQDLRYAIATNCLYGVDLDPLAVELCLLTLFLEVDHCQSKPEFFTLLRAKLKRGNALVGAWRGAANNEVEPWEFRNRSELRDQMDAFCAQSFVSSDDWKGGPCSPSKQSDAFRKQINSVRDRFAFFHWELEFADVFDRDNPGFDAVVGNPPWEIEKPNSREFFSRFDSEYWNYGKQDALQRQREIFDADAAAQAAWAEYLNGYNGFRKFIKLSSASSSFSQPVLASSFCHQGKADLNAYKLFLEQSHNVLRRGGIMSLIVPAGIYSDLGNRELRNLFVHRSRWQSILGFENRKGLFNIHRSFKFCIVAVQKGGATDNIQTRFLLTDAAEKLTAPFSYSSSFIEKFSPSSATIIECESHKDLQILDKLYSSSHTLEDWNVAFEREFDMTNDSSRFAPRPSFEADGYMPDQYGNWLLGGWRKHTNERPDLATILSADGTAEIRIQDIEDIALPLYEGRMIGQFDFSQKMWISGKGRRADWLELSLDEKQLRPQYLVRGHEYQTWKDEVSLRCGYLAVGSPTNSRSMIASAVDSLPCGNSVPVLKTGCSLKTLSLVACLNSFVFDYALRCRLSGNNLNYFLVAESPLPAYARIAELPDLASIAAQLNLNHIRFAPFWNDANHVLGWDCAWVNFEQSRRLLRSILDAVIAHVYGLTSEDLRWILRGCDNSISVPVKGFWRAEKDLPAQLKHSTLTLQAFEQIKQHGCRQFLSQSRDPAPSPRLALESISAHAQRLANLKNRFV